MKLNIEKATLENKAYRKVIATTKTTQLVLMRLSPNEEIGMEVHPHTTQFIRVEGGTGTAVIGTQNYRLKDGDALVIPPKTRHNVKAGALGLNLYTLYSPPHHPPNTLQIDKPEDD
jgi:mannose-6-phosphate isomerase-like protein (cupin superfamily)